MTAFLLSEDRISLTGLAEQEGIHPSTVARWCSPRGFKGIVLESFNIGFKKFTTRQAYARWLNKINETELSTA